MQAQQDLDFAEAAAHLSGNPFFKAFLTKIREFRTIAVEDACNVKAVSDERVTTSLLGEIRAYSSIIDLCENVGLGEPVD